MHIVACVVKAVACVGAFHEPPLLSRYDVIRWKQQATRLVSTDRDKLVGRVFVDGGKGGSRFVVEDCVGSTIRGSEIS